MKILVIGLDGGAPELLFGDERLSNFRRLMEIGCYGRLESVIPPTTVPAWMCLATSQDPGSLGVYGCRNRIDHSYTGLEIINSRSITAPAIWDQLAREAKRSNIIGVPPGLPPRTVNGISVGCFLPPAAANQDYTHPANVKETIAQLVGDYPVDVQGLRTNDTGWLKDEIYTMSRKHFVVVRHFLQHSDWDYFQFVEIGLDRMHHGFWRYHDKQHLRHEPGNPYQEVIRDYYRYLDDELGQILALLDDDTVVLITSDHGAQRLDGGFCVNEWLVREGLLVLNEYPKEVTPFDKLSVAWEKTKVWSEGGSCARIYFNIKGREPQGTIDPADYAKFRDGMIAKLEPIVDGHGKLMGNLVFKPEAIYRNMRNVAPDLIAHFGALSWRSIGGVGYPTLHVRENAIGPDDCNPAQFGAFILAGGSNPLRGEVNGAHLLDLAPTLLTLGGHDVPPSMQGRLLTANQSGPGAVLPADDEEIVRQQLSGLGYI